jgi:predicted RND superfamily exporter protein
VFPVPQEDFVPLLQSDDFAAYLRERARAHQDAGRHWDSPLEHQHTGWIIEDGRLKFAWMTFNATFKAQGTKDVQNEWHERWEGHMLSRAGASNPRQSSEMYVFMVLQNELLAACIQGMLVSLVVTAVILALVTFNWILALIGLINITIITGIFLGVMPLIPWELGSSECIFLIAVVGLAVDYTVHLLHAYNEQDGTREEKMQGALSTMGISVASGAITTMGAGLMLFMCDIAFFQQFGSFIFLVILISFLVALTNLPPLILILGPEGDRGKIAPLYWLHSRLAARDHGDTHKQPEEDHASEAA